MPDRPNVLFVMTDQQRGDCLGVEDHPCLLTPTMDSLAHHGTRFRHAYTTCPVCIPARRSLMTGTFPSTHGLVGYRDGQPWDAPTTLPTAFRDAGYQTAIVGRNMHLSPRRKRYGFEEMVISTGKETGDYEQFLARQMPEGGGGYYGSGVMHNDWTARPWHLDEHLHRTNWTVNQALDFLQRRRDPSCPYFLTVSFIAPHPPLHPPAPYFERYLRTGVPDPVIGTWADPPPDGITARSPNASRVNLEGEALRAARAAYFGLINHVDDQLRRILNGVTGIDTQHTIIVFTSDHGEMLGDHYRWRKSQPYEPAARIPYLIRLPDEWKTSRGQAIDEAVCLEDLMPTLLELCGIRVPDTVEGSSLVPLLTGDRTRLDRPYVPLEHSGGWHALTDGTEKYVWRSDTGREQFFDLDDDPHEETDRTATQRGRVAAWRDRLIERLEDRPEGFVDDGELVAGRPHSALIPG